MSGKQTPDRLAARGRRDDLLSGALDAGLTRRAVLQAGLYGAAGMLLGGWSARPRRVRQIGARAKSVIQIWMWGGPCHLDTFDPKPEAGNDYCGPLKKPIPTNVDGIRICELLPQLAAQADKLAIIRSMTHGVFAHETASYLVQTGWPNGGGLVHPCLGAVVSYFRGERAGREGLIPPYIVLTQPQGRFSEAGFLGMQYKPFATGGNPAQGRFAVEGIVSEGITDERQRRRRQLLERLDRLKAAHRNDQRLAPLVTSEERAYDLILGDAGKVFDLSLEDDDLRQRYGRSPFGQSCLVARRLVEQGVPYVTINYKGWDTHKQHFEAMRRNLPQLDSGMATLLADLSERGLLESTIVWWSGEFGRTPRIKWEAPWNGGRGHWGKVFSAVLAGGGFRGGQVVGASDARGEEVAERPVYPWDLLASVYERLGLGADASLSGPQGQSIPVSPGLDQVSESGGLLREIM